MVNEKAQKHIEQWKHNRRFVTTIDRAYRDWQINAIFYTALHLVDAALASLNVSVSDHTQRNDEIRGNGSFAAIRHPYLNLYRISQITRYDADPDKWIPTQFTEIKDLVHQVYRPIEEGLFPLIDKKMKYEPLAVRG